MILATESTTNPKKRLEALLSRAEDLNLTILRLATLKGFVGQAEEELFFASIWHQPGRDGHCALFREQGKRQG